MSTNDKNLNSEIETLLEQTSSSQNYAAYQ